MEDLQLKLKKLQTHFESGKNWASVLTEVNWQLGKMDVGYVQLSMPQDRGFTRTEMLSYQKYIEEFFKSLKI